MFICSYVFIHSLQVKFLSLFIWSYVLIHSLQAFYLDVYLFICIDSFISRKAFIFMIICSDVLIRTLQVKQWEISDVRRKAAETRSSTLPQIIQNFPWKPGCCGTNQSRVIAEPTNPSGICHSGFVILDLKMLMYNFHVSNSNG